MSGEVVQAQYEQLDAVARGFGKQAEANRDLQRRVQHAVQALRNGGWQGRGSAAFLSEMDSRVAPTLVRLITAMHEAQRATLEMKEIIQQAEEEAARVFAGGNHTPIPLGANDDAGVPPIDADTRDSRRNDRNDRRTDRRIQSDERWRRKPETTGDSHLDNDWAGRTLLERYLTGEGDLTINNDPRWKSYMESSPMLTEKLREKAIATAQDLHQQFTQGGVTQTSFNERGPMEMENGEGIVGHQYLHGTNTNAGGFQRVGTAQIAPDGGGGYIVTTNINYTWNDIIDPNPTYNTDTWKSRVAELITLGRADGYEVHISWTEQTTMRLDANGQVVSIQNK